MYYTDIGQAENEFEEIDSDDNGMVTVYWERFVVIFENLLLQIVCMQALVNLAIVTEWEWIVNWDNVTTIQLNSTQLQLI